MAVVKKIISTLLVSAAAIGIGLALALYLPEQGAQQPAISDPAETADTAVHIGRLPGYENSPQNTTPEYFYYLFNAALNMGQDGSLPVMLENTPGNECVMRVRYSLSDGRDLLVTPVIRPGEYLLYSFPSELPQAGEYLVVVSIMVYHDGQNPDTDEPFASYTEQASLTVPKGAVLTANS